MKMKTHIHMVKGKGNTRINNKQAVVELKNRVIVARVVVALNKLVDRDTYQIGVDDLEETIECLRPDGVAPFLSCILDTDPKQKSMVRKECVRLLGVFATFHEGLIGTYLGKMVASIVKRLKDSDSVVRDACVETVGILASKLNGSIGENDGVFLVLVRPLFEALGEQNKQMQFGSALCLSRVIDNIHNPPASILQQMLPRTVKLLKNPHFMAKPAIIVLTRSIVQAGGAATHSALSAAMTSIQEALKNSDWTTRKAASSALGDIASSGGACLGSFRSSCIRCLESCRFDRVNPVRDIALQALHLWKNLPGSDTPKPSETGSSVKGTHEKYLYEEDKQLEEEDADIGEEDEMADFIVDEEENEHGAPRKKKPKMTGKTQGISLSALQDFYDIFGDYGDLLKIRKKSLARGLNVESGQWKKRRLEDESEPLILSEKYMTEKDDRGQEIDIPERMQISEESTGPPPRDKLVMKEQKDDIARFLELSHVQKFEVPFIAMYRKEEILSLLKLDQDQPEQKPRLRWHKILWMILNWDKKWLLLQKMKSALESCYKKRFEEESRRVYNETQLNLNRWLFASIAKSLKAAKSEREVADVGLKLDLHFPAGEVGAGQGQFKQPIRKSRYSDYKKAGLSEVVSKFGCSFEQFGIQIPQRMTEVEDANETPEEMASNFKFAMFETPQAVLRGASFMAAVEISSEPCLRKHVRSIYMENAIVSTSPTPYGDEVIDYFHQFAGVKRLYDNPLRRFEDAQWLLIQKAEEEKLLKVTIKLPVPVLEKLISESNGCYLIHGVGKSAQLWSEQSKRILQYAFDKLLLPSMEKEARSLLTSRAKNWLLWEYGKHLWDKVSISSYQQKQNNANSDDEAAPRVLACCWSPGDPPTTFVMLDSSGEVLDVLYAGSLGLGCHTVNDRQLKENDLQRVQKFMMDHLPHVIVLGAVNLSCRSLKDDIYEIIYRTVEKNRREESYYLDVVYGDESLPRVYENSCISTDQLPGRSGIVRRAAALGRYLQNPLAMVATLCGPGKDILYWRLHPFQNFLTSDEKYGMVEAVMVDATNQVGLKINLDISREWLLSPLQFVAGLGPRKAASLRRSLVRAGAIFTRDELMTVHGLGKKVFFNAVGFLRVRRSGLTSSSSAFISLLKNTRIHPESYGPMEELANGDANDDNVFEMAFKHLREKRSLLSQMDIHGYAEQNDRLNIEPTRIDIGLELEKGFQDWRRPYSIPALDDEFYMICGETEETLSEGRIVHAIVCCVSAREARCLLDSGFTGMLYKEDHRDDWKDITDNLRAGDVLTCRIKSIQKGQYQVCLTCNE